MAAKKELGKGKTSRKTSSSTGNKAGSTTGNTNGKPAGEEAKRKRTRAGAQAGGNDGAEQLRQAADEAVGRNSAKLADALAKKALGGDLASTKMLMALAEAKKSILAVKEPGPSLALWLSAQPQWKENAQEKEEGTSEDAK